MLTTLLAKAGFVALAGLVSSVAADLPVISVSGNKFYDPEGKQFFIKGELLYYRFTCMVANGLPQALPINSSQMIHSWTRSNASLTQLS